MKKYFAFLIMAIITVCFTLFSALPCFALTITPVPIEVEYGHMFSNLYIDDDGKSYEVEVFRWEQDNNGNEKLTVSSDVVIYPTVAKTPKNIRIALQSKFSGEKEESFRIILTEIPPAEPVNSSGIRVLKSLSLPIFFKPSKSKAVVDYKKQCTPTGMSITNSGTLHLLIKAGDNLVYVLPGNTVPVSERTAYIVERGKNKETITCE